MKHIKFSVVKELPKTKVYQVISTEGDIPLGIIKWYPSWRQYCFFPYSTSLYSWDCLQEITDKIKELKEERKVNKQMKGALMHG